MRGVGWGGFRSHQAWGLVAWPGLDANDVFQKPFAGGKSLGRTSKTENTMTLAQIGFIGCGNFIRNNHLLTARDSENMEIRAIADLDKDVLADVSARMKVGYTTTDYKKLLDDRDVDIVVIGTKQNLHAKFIVESLDAGKWVYCEKPMAETEEETQAVLAAEQRNPGKLAIGFNRRFAPAYSEAKKLMAEVQRPWFIHYRLMWKVPVAYKKFHDANPHILYEGCHILDLVCWLLDSVPRRVYMTGDRGSNNICTFDYSDGSRVSFMCGSMNSVMFNKEYMEIFGHHKAIAVNDFIEMKIRGFEGQTDRLFSTYRGNHAEEIKKYGIDFYEAYKVQEEIDRFGPFHEADEIVEPLKKALPYNFDISQYSHDNPEVWAFIPDKGWRVALEHFAQCFLDGRRPDNADGKAGALVTRVALALLESVDTGQPVDIE
jgi:predicted dehydrogenase